MKSNSSKPFDPVKPSAMEVILVYKCPLCRRELPMIAPLQPGIVRCDSCAAQFPIVPAEERSITFMKLMLANGSAAIDPDFM